MKEKINNAKKHRLVIAVLVLLFAVVMAVTVITGSVTLRSRRAQAADLRESYAEASRINEELHEQLSEGSYEERLERAAREDGYVYNNERVVIDAAPNM